MTKTLVALVLIAGGILLVTRLVDTDKPVPARLSPPTDQISEARRVSPTMSARDLQSYRSLAEVLLFEAEYYGCRSKDHHASRRRKPLQRVRRRRPRYEKSWRADGARLDTARPFGQGRAGELLSTLAVSRP
jgi:hypothetical protein